MATDQPIIRSAAYGTMLRIKTSILKVAIVLYREIRTFSSGRPHIFPWILQIHFPAMRNIRNIRTRSPRFMIEHQSSISLTSNIVMTLPPRESHQSLENWIFQIFHHLQYYPENAQTYPVQPLFIPWSDNSKGSPVPSKSWGFPGRYTYYLNYPDLLFIR